MTDKPQAPDADQLPDLTPKQMAFVKGILDGLSASDAYRQAYDCSGTKNEAIWVSASRLRSNANVHLWLAAARRAGLDKAGQTIEQHIAELNESKQFAVDLNDAKTALKAVEDKGHVQGFYIQRHEHTVNNTAAILAEIKALDPDAAKYLASRFALPSTGTQIDADSVSKPSAVEDITDEENPS